MKVPKYLLPALLLFGILFLLCIYFRAMPLKEAESTPQKRYIVIVPTDAINQNLALQNGIQAAAAERNVYVKFLEVSYFSEQETEVEKALYSGFDGIILCPMIDGMHAWEMLDTIQESQMELVTLFNEITGDWPCIASARYIGEQAAETMLSLTRTPENVYILTGNSQNIVYQKRAAAFSSYLQEQDITVADTLSLNIDIVSSADQVRKYISKNHIQYLFCTDAASSASAARCMDSQLLVPPVIIGCDYLQTTETYFNPEYITSLICTEYYDAGYEAVCLLDNLVSGAEIPDTPYRQSCVTTYDASNPLLFPGTEEVHAE